MQLMSMSALSDVAMPPAPESCLDARPRCCRSVPRLVDVHVKIAQFLAASLGKYPLSRGLLGLLGAWSLVASWYLLFLQVCRLQCWCLCGVTKWPY